MTTATAVATQPIRDELTRRLGDHVLDELPPRMSFALVLCESGPNSGVTITSNMDRLPLSGVLFTLASRIALQDAAGAAPHPAAPPKPVAH